MEIFKYSLPRHSRLMELVIIISIAVSFLATCTLMAIICQVVQDPLPIMIARAFGSMKTYAIKGCAKCIYIS